MTNHGKYNTEQYKIAQAARIDERYGPVTEHTKICQNPKCGEEYIFVGREHTAAFRTSRFCSRSCANARGGYAVWRAAKDEIHEYSNYKKVCFYYHGRQCVVCDHDDVIEVHHLDNDRSNENIDNLIPVCPTHHRILHFGKTKDEIMDVVMKYINMWKEENGHD